MAEHRALASGTPSKARRTAVLTHKGVGWEVYLLARRACHSVPMVDGKTLVSPPCYFKGKVPAFVFSLETLKMVLKDMTPVLITTADQMMISC